MGLLRAPTTILSTVALLLASSHSSQAVVATYSKISQVTISVDADASDYDLHNTTLAKRWSSCANPCGWYGQVCCNADEACYTDGNNQAACSSSGAGAGAPATTVAAQTAVATGPGNWQYYTSTWVETETGVITRTAVYSSWIPSAATAVVATSASCVPNYANGEQPCGSICCAGNQYCYAMGTCRNFAGYTTQGVTASAPARGTSITGVIITATISPTTTVPFSTPVATGQSSGNGTVIPSGSSSHLSGGAIAGIVIGVIAAIILLLLICLFCCLRAGFDGLLALFGIGRRRNRRRSRVVEEEIIEHRRHGSAAASADGRRWYGSGYDRPSRPPPSRRSNQRRTGGLGGLGAVTAGLGGLALALGLKRRADQRRRDEEKSNSATYSYYDSYYDSSSSGGSDDRTQRSSRIVRSTSRSRR